MAKKARKKLKKDIQLFPRILRSIFAVVVLSALVLGISLGIKELAAFDNIKFAKITSPLLAKFPFKVTEDKVSEFAGSIASRISQTSLSSTVSKDNFETVDQNLALSNLGGQGAQDESHSVYASEEVVGKVAIMSDVHEDLGGLQYALNKAKESGVTGVLLLGDLTNYGDVETLNAVKNLLDSSGLKYYSLPGDHDIAQTTDTGNFEKVFGNVNRVITMGNAKFILFNNSANFTIISPDEMLWLQENISNADFVMLSQPLYTVGLSSMFKNVYMGSTMSEPEDGDQRVRQESVRDQGAGILTLIRSTNSVKAVFAGDHHKSSMLEDSQKSELTHYVVGAVTSTLNEYPQEILQKSRFTLLTLYKDGGYKVEDVVLD